MKPALSLALALALVPACTAPAPIEVTFRIEPADACRDLPPRVIRSVRIVVSGARGGIECIETSKCVTLEIEPLPTRIEDVQAALPTDLEMEEVVAGRGYRIEAVGFGTRDCLVGGMLDQYLFCGQSAPTRLDSMVSVVPITATCDVEAQTCAGSILTLRFCQ